VSDTLATSASENEVTVDAGPLASWPPYFALVVAWTAMIGSLYFSEINHFEPCRLCWYQRILMYPLTIVIAVGILRRDRILPAYVLPMSLLGAAVATYHVLLQKTNWFTESAACKAGVPCSSDYINWFGFITIPILALAAFLLITFSISAARREADETWAAAGTAPWLRVALSIAAVWVFFVGIYLVAN
jgi:disulfide bond formation protein DsbB